MNHLSRITSRMCWLLSLALVPAAAAAPSGEGAGTRLCGTRLLALRTAQIPPPDHAGKSLQPAQEQAEITVGSQLGFPILGSPFLLQATCQFVGEHAFVFVEDRQWDTNGGSVLQSHVDALAELFDRATPADPSRGVYELSSQAFGEPPDVDGYPQIFILILDIADPIFIGYFDPAVAAHPVPELRRDVIYLDERAVRRDSYLARGTLSHEFQHLIHWGQDPDEESWINEGLSGYAEELIGYPEADPAAVPAFLAQPDVDFTNWPARAPPAYYGSTYLLASFLAERFGQSFIRDLVAQPRNGRFGVDDAFTAGGLAEDFDSAWAQWVVANYTRADGVAGYGALGERSAVTFPIEQLPTDVRGQVRGQWGTSTVLFRTPGDLSIEFDGDDGGRFRVWGHVMRGGRAVELVELDLGSDRRGRLTATDIDSLALIVGKTSFQGGGEYSVSANRPVITAISQGVSAPVVSTRLASPFPNPFNSAVTIPFTLHTQSGAARLAIYSANGQPVRRWHLGSQTAGPHQIVWDGRDESGHAVASGSYSIELKVGSTVENRRLTHLK